MDAWANQAYNKEAHERLFTKDQPHRRGRAVESSRGAGG